MTEQQNSLATIPQNPLTNAEFKKKHNELAKFVKSQLRESKDIAGGQSGDYGVIPYTKKKSLLKPGAEKLLKLFGLSAQNVMVKEVEDWDKKFVLYKYKCIITHTATGAFIADATRSCNNKEKKHATKDVYDVANTIESVAQKRALVAATVQATMASEIFDADVSDSDEEAPNKPVTKEEDPRRIQVMSRLYGTAKEHGWNDEWIHRAIKKKWDLDSLTKCSNSQIEELTEFIAIKYETVPAGAKPKLKEEKVAADPEALKEAAIDGEVVEDTPGKYTCQGPKHAPDQRPETTIDDPWCSEECKNDYFGGPQKDRKDPAQNGWKFGK